MESTFRKLETLKLLLLLKKVFSFRDSSERLSNVWIVVEKIQSPFPPPEKKKKKNGKVMSLFRKTKKKYYKKFK